MGDLKSFKLLTLGTQALIVARSIYFLDNGFHPLATSQEVCGAWQKQSEVRDRSHCVRLWSTLASRQGLARLHWRRSSDVISLLSRVSRAANAGLMSLSWSYWLASLALIHLGYLQSLNLQHSLTIEFEKDCFENTGGVSAGLPISPFPQEQLAKTNEVWCVASVNVV